MSPDNVNNGSNGHNGSPVEPKQFIQPSLERSPAWVEPPDGDARDLVARTQRIVTDVMALSEECLRIRDQHVQQMIRMAQNQQAVGDIGMAKNLEAAMATLTDLAAAVQPIVEVFAAWEARWAVEVGPPGPDDAVMRSHDYRAGPVVTRRQVAVLVAAFRRPL